MNTVPIYKINHIYNIKFEENLICWYNKLTGIVDKKIDFKPYGGVKMYASISYHRIMNNNNDFTFNLPYEFIKIKRDTFNTTTHKLDIKNNNYSIEHCPYSRGV